MLLLTLKHAMQYLGEDKLASVCNGKKVIHNYHLPLSIFAQSQLIHSLLADLGWVMRADKRRNEAVKRQWHTARLHAATSPIKPKS